MYYMYHMYYVSCIEKCIMHRAWNVCESIIGGVRDGKILKIVDGIGGVACILGCIRPILHKYEVWVEVVRRF